MTPILSTIYSTFKSSTTPNIISKNTKSLLSTINTKMPSSIYQFDEISYIYETTLQKFNNYQEQEKSLRKFVLLRNFYINQFLILPPDDDQHREKQYSDGDNNNYHIEHFNEKLEWSEDDDVTKKEEETWLDACLDDASLDEYDDGYVYVTKPEDNDQRETGKDDGIIREGEKELITNYKKEIIIPNDLSLEESKNNNISDQGFHPYWKDNSIIRQQQQQQPSSTPHPSLPPPSIDHYRPFFDQKSQTNNVSSNNSLEKNKNDNKAKNDNETNKNNSKNNNNDDHNNSGGNFKIRSFSIPKIFHKYKLGYTILDLLQLDDQSSPYSFEQPATATTNRSQDDLDMLFYSQPKVLLDHRMLSDIISMSMLEWYGGKKSNPLNDSNNINNNNLTNTTPIATTTTMTPTELIISTNNWLVGSGRC